MRVLVRLRPAIHDPQGETIRRALAGAGEDSVRSVRQGKLFELEIAAPSEDAARHLAHEIAAQVLANPVLEDFTVELPEEEGAP